MEDRTYWNWNEVAEAQAAYRGDITPEAREYLKDIYKGPSVLLKPIGRI